MKYLIIGGAGFIGSNFADKLLGRGDSVIVFDNLSRRGAIENVNWLSKNHKNLELIVGDIRTDKNKLADLVNKSDVVYHLAAQVAVTTSVKDPEEDFEINALGTFNVLEAIRKSENKPPIIFSSTNKVYGGMEDIKIVERNDRYEYKDYPGGISEERLLDFHSPYGCSKGAGDQYVRDYARIYGLKTVVMRQSCIYGPRQFGIEDQGWVAWFLIASTLGKEITIYGDGKQVRDVLHVDDLFEAWDLAIKKNDLMKGQVFNIGGGKDNTLSLLELLSFIEKERGIKVNYKFSEWRPGDQPVYVSSIEKAKKMLNWHPRIDTKKGITLLADWIEANQNLFDFLK